MGLLYLLINSILTFYAQYLSIISNFQNIVHKKLVQKYVKTFLYTHYLCFGQEGGEALGRAASVTEWWRK